MLVLIVVSACQKEAKERMEHAPSPPDGIKDVHGIRAALCGDQAVVHGGRPASNYGPPPALFHSALAKFDNHLHHLDGKLDELAPDSDLLHSTHLLIQQCLDVYDSDNDRAQALDETLSAVLRANIFKRRQRQHSDSTVGWVWEDDDWHAVVVLELKNESGIGGSAFLRAALMYARVVSDREVCHLALSRLHPALMLHQYPGRLQRTNHPVILVGIAGDHIELGSAIFLGDGVHHSTPFSQRLRLGFHAHDNVFRLAQAFMAISLAAKSIANYYTDIKKHPPPADSIAHLFPAPTRLDGDPLPDGLRFRCGLSRAAARFTLPRDTEDQRTGLYIATMPARAATPPSTAAAAAPDIEVVVKFTARYNADAHRLLASAGHAPQLYSCARVCGGLYMVVMELVPGKPLGYWVAGEVRVPRSVYTDIEAALGVLHAAGLVFGDLRPPNVVCVPSASAPEPSDGPEEEQPGARGMLVDFDWAGTVGVDRYPATLDDSLPDWAAGVERYGVMRTEHDRAMLKMLEELCEEPPVDGRVAPATPSRGCF